MNAKLRNIARASLVLGATALLLAGCLFSIDGEPEDGGVLKGGTVFLTSVSFEEDGLDPPGDEDEDSDSDTYDFGPYCAMLVECVCEGLSPGQYADCLDSIADMSENGCQSILESDYEECLPDSGLSD
ncbi:MAG: hypothetical protein JRF63_00045 [Deltaproteobacteria bacterium]|nr:hypothetical protein [Deltaproteobacteria bacterium]